MKPIRQWLAACASAFALVACGGGSDDGTNNNPPPVQAGTITGKVVGMDSDTPLAGARISVGGRNVQTAADGSFTLTEVPPGERLVVQAEAAEHGANVAIVKLGAGTTADIRVRLLKLSATQNFSAAQAATVGNAEGTAQVQLPAGALVNAATGAAAAGTLSASITDIDPARDPERMPGGFTTQLPSGQVSAIESFGAVKVDLRDAAGNRLNLASGKSATIRIPLSTRSPNPPATVPLFYFDEASGRWVKEGTATLVANGTAPYYEGTVTHFSYWNADKEAETVEVEGCVVKADGSPAAGVQVSASGVDYSGRSSSFTDNEGRFRIAVRRDSTTGIWAATDTQITPVHEVQVGQFGGAMAGNCMKLEASTSPIPGKLSPKIMMQPRSTTAAAGEAAMMQVIAEGTQPIKYEWSRNGQVMPGQSTSMLWIAPASMSDNGAVFSVRITNAAGTVASASATLTVTSTATVPTILMSPADQVVTAGQTASFTVAVNGSAPLSYQWRRNGQPIAGATDAVYSFTTEAADDGALFSVEVSNAAGAAVSSAAKLTVIAQQSPPVVVTPPHSLVANVGDSVTFAVVAQGSGTLTYQWQRNGNNIAGATAASYTLGNVAASDGGAQFRVIVTNAQGSVTSTAATLTVNSGTEDQQAKLLRLMGLWMDGAEAAGAPLEFADEDFKMQSIAAVCTAGTATVTLDGAAAPAAGQALPSGSHTLAAQFADCDRGFGQLYAGSSSLAYNFANVAQRNGTAKATISNFRFQGMDLNGDPSTSTVQGVADMAVDGGVNGTQETVQLRFTPAAGLSITDGAGAAPAVFNSGSVLLHNVVDAVSSRPQVTRQEYSQLSFTRGGVVYVVDGFLQFDFNAQGVMVSGSGTVTVTAGGQLIGRISATTGGFAVEVIGSPALKPSASAKSTAARKPTQGVAREMTLRMTNGAALRAWMQ